MPLENVRPQPIASEESMPVQYRWTRARFQSAVDAGVFDFDPHVELIGGEIKRRMSPQKSPHMAAIGALQEALSGIFTRGYSIRIQGPLALGNDSEPEPDVAVVAGSWRDYKLAHPTTAILVVEVADSTIQFDRSEKAGLYARSGIADYWIVNLRDRLLEVHRSPAASLENPFGFIYADVSRLGVSDSVSPLVSPNSSIAVSDLIW